MSQEEFSVEFIKYFLTARVLKHHCGQKVVEFPKVEKLKKANNMPAIIYQHNFLMGFRP